MTTCKRGDVIIVRFPNSDGVTYKKRPALVVQSDTLQTDLANRLVVCITKTSRTGATRISVRKETPQGQQMGILMDSVIVVDNIATVRDREIDKVAGIYPDMPVVDRMLRRVLDI
jgi:mRNA interferase MazF